MSNKLILSLFCFLTLTKTSQAVHKHRPKNITARIEQLERDKQTYGQLVDSLEEPRAQLNAWVRTFPRSHPDWQVQNDKYNALIKQQTNLQILQTEALTARLRLTRSVTISEKRLAKKAAKAAQLAEQEAERYFIAGLAARRAHGRKPSRQESEILNRFGTKIK